MSLKKTALNFLGARKLAKLIRLCLPTSAGRKLLVRLCEEDKELERYLLDYVVDWFGPPATYHPKRRSRSRVAPPMVTHVTVNAVDAQSFYGYIQQNNKAIADAVLSPHDNHPMR